MILIFREFSGGIMGTARQTHSHLLTTSLTP